MVRISTFVYSDTAQQGMGPDGNHSLTIQNPMQLFKPAFIPSLFSFSITLGIAGVDLLKQHQVRLTFSKLDGSEHLIETGEIVIPANEEGHKANEGVPLEYRGYLFNLDFRNVAFRTEGEYVSTVYVDGVELGKHPVYVKSEG